MPKIHPVTKNPYLWSLLQAVWTFRDMTGEEIHFEYLGGDAVRFTFTDTSPEQQRQRVLDGLNAGLTEWILLHKRVTVARLNGLVVQGWLETE